MSTMTVVLLWEWDNPKDEARNKKRLKFDREEGAPFWEKKRKEGIKLKMTSWSDNTGHIVGWMEFETMDDFSKLWEDKEWQQQVTKWSYLVDNVSVRLLRPTITLPEEK